MKKRIGTLVTSATAFLLLTAVPALAEPGSAHNPRPGGPGVGASGGTAFTGANVSAGLLWLAALVVVGALALYAGYRRAAASR